MLTFILQNIHHKNFSRCYYIIAVKGDRSHPRETAIANT